jgi:hypothetical protein
MPDEPCVVLCTRADVRWARGSNRVASLSPALPTISGCHGTGALPFLNHTLFAGVPIPR